MATIDAAESCDPEVLRRLRAHPAVTLATEGEQLLGFQQGERKRTVLQGACEEPLYGLIELMDNNPLVCADRASIPSPAATLALIALGPALLAGLITRPPILFLNLPSAGDEVLVSLRKLAPLEQLRLITPREDPSVMRTVEAAVFGKEAPAQGMLAAQAAFEVPISIGTPELSDIFAERFGHSFYVRARTGVGHMRPADELAAKPFALYTVEVARGAITNQALIEVAADPAGKPGATGLIHAMNIMAGLEESLGI